MDTPRGASPPKLFAVVRESIRRRHYSPRIEETYIDWMKRFVVFSGRRHPRDLGEAEVSAFLNHLARDRKVAASTQNQALAALVFLYREILKQPLPWLDGLERARRPARLPSVLSVAEAERLLACLAGERWIMASLLYGAGLRLRECLGLRVMDIDFDCAQIVVRNGKGAKDRVTMLPAGVVRPLHSHLARVRSLHDADLASGCGEAEPPEAFARTHAGAPTSGDGSSCSRLGSSRSIRAAARCAAIRCTRTISPERSSRRRARRES